MKRLLLALCLIMVFGLSFAEQFTVSDHQNDVRLITSNQNEIVMEMNLGHFEREAEQINGSTYYNLHIKKEGLALEAGLPQVPVISRSVIIPANAKMEISTLNSEYIEIPMAVAPSKGNLFRDVNPADVPYTFDNFYNGNEFYPKELALNTEPFIIRDFRGMTVRFQPFVYYPKTQTLRVYTTIRIALYNTGTDLTNALPQERNAYNAHFSEIYKSLFLNFEQTRYPILEEEGRILVITHSMFNTAIQPYVNWKRQMGYTVDVVDVAVAGPTANQIKTYITNQYNQNDGLVFVQIVGDAPQVPTLSSGGGGADPMYALITGNDNYPEIFVGRFSAENVAQLDTQVQRTIHYERDIQAGSDWLQKAMGIASNEGGGSQGDMGESDQAHMELIRTDLLGYGYTSVDQMYQATGATATQVANNLNLGRGFINYVGHGSNTTWVTTGFSNTNVNNLTNSNMLPFIVSVACVNGNFVSITCFAEAWLRATHNTTGEPTGAIAHYASTINQSWNPPMRGQDEITDLLIAEAKQTIGGLYFNGSSRMTEVYGTAGADMYKTWHIFGDASLVVRTKDPLPMTANYTPVMFLGMNNFEVVTVPGARVAISNAGVLMGMAIADASGIASIVFSNPPQEPMDLTITITAFNRVTHIGTIQVLPSTGPYVTVANVVVTDDNNNTPEYGEIVNLNVNLNNVGAVAASDVTVFITTTDPYLTILTSEETIGNIPANGTGGTTTGFSVQIADNVPDQHAAQFEIMISTDTDEVWNYSRGFVINAPALGFGGLSVSEVVGNNNGRIDAGETVILSFPILNTGSAQAMNVLGSILIDGVPYQSSPMVTDFYAIPAGGDASMLYEVTFSSQIPVGTSIQIMALLSSGGYAASETYNVTVGMVMEDFEAGFNSYPWAFTGGNWTIDQQTFYSGTRSAKSSAISHNATTSMAVTMNIPANGTITFWKKVSSESNYDFLKFYINNVLKGSWSGEVNWSQESYEVVSGNNTFRWDYVKDNIVSSGSDCAWIDEIIFPAVGGTTGSPSVMVSVDTMEFGEIPHYEFVNLPITITNVGDAVMLGSMTTPEPFFIAPMGGDLINSFDFNLQPGMSLEMDISFFPNMQEGEFSGTLIINTDDPTNMVTEIPLHGTSATVANDDQVVPFVTALKSNYPNPFNPITTIEYSIKDSAPVSIEVYNILGQRIRTLVNEPKKAGNYSVTWNGTDNNGRAVASGIYFYRMQSGKFTSTKKMIMLK